MRKIFLLLIAVCFAAGINAQISVTVTGNANTTPTLSTSYDSLAGALTALNSVTAMSGPVTFTLSAGSETAAPTGFTIGSATLNPVLSAVNTVTINTSGGTVTLNAGVGTATPSSAAPDGILKLTGADWVTIDGLTLTDTNTTNPGTMEFGIGLFKLGAEDGARNNTIKNCTINMQRANFASGTAPMIEGSVGILMINSTAAAATTALTVTAVSGANSNNKFYSNTINGGNYGMGLIGYAAASPYSLADTANDIGGSSAGTGNSILNYGGGTGSLNPSAAIRTLAQYGLNISYNTINNNNGSGVNHPAVLRGIYTNTAAGASETISNNTITVSSGATAGQQLTVIENAAGSTANSNTISINKNTITSNYATATSGASTYGIYNNSTTPANFNANGNTITLNTATPSGSLTGILQAGAIVTTLNIDSNTVSFTLSAASTTATVRGVSCGFSASTCATSISGNTFQSFSFTGATGGSGRVDCIYHSATPRTSTISGNNFNNLTLKTSGTIYMISNSYTAPANGSKTIQNNIITTGVVRNGAGSSAMYGYQDAGSSASTVSHTISGNDFSKMNNGTSAGNLYAIYSVDYSSSNPTLNIYNNTITNLTASGLIYGIYANGFGGTSSSPNGVYGNTISNLITNSGTGLINGIYVGSQSLYVDVHSNTVDSLTSGSSGVVNGLNVAGGTQVLNIYSNNIYSISGSNSGSVSIGLNVVSGATINVYKNKIYSISGSNTTTVSTGLNVSGGTIVNLYNNLIGNLTASSSNTVTAVSGITIAAGTTINAYYNTIYLPSLSSTGAAFGASGIYMNSTSSSVNLRNNIVYITGTANGTAKIAALRRVSGTAGTVPSTYAATSNNNLFYAGTPSDTNLIYTEGTSSFTNSMRTLAAYKTFMADRDQLSATENVSFQSTSGSSDNFLKYNTAIASQAERGAAAITDFTTDYAGTTRNATAPDIGAWELNGLVSDLNNPVITYTSLPNTVCTSGSTLTATITDPSGVNATTGTAPRLYYKKKTNANTYAGNTSADDGWKYVEAGNASSPFSFTLNSSLLQSAISAGDTIQYFVVAQDSATTPNVGIGSGSFAAAPASVDLTSAAFPISGTINYFTIVTAINTSVTIGAAGTYASLTGSNGLFAAINAGGLSANTVATIVDASVTETGAVALNQISYGCSGPVTLTIKPQTTASLTGTKASAGLIKLNGADNVIINGSNNDSTDRSLTIGNTASTAPCVIHIASLGTGAGAANIIIKNCRINMGGVTTGTAYGISVSGSLGAGGADNDNVTIQNNAINSSNVGVYTIGTAAGLLDNLSITGNDFTSSSNLSPNYGVRVGYATGASVANNTYNLSATSSSATPVAISIETGTESSSVTGNKVTACTTTASGYGGRGITVGTGSASSNITISNNFIAGVNGSNYSVFNSTSMGIAIGIVGNSTVTLTTITGGVNLFYNTVNMSGAYSYADNCVTSGLYVGVNASALDVRNNIFVNSMNNTNGSGTNSKNYGVFSAAGNTAFTTMDFNDYYVSGTQGMLGFLSSNQDSLSKIRTAFGGNANSINVQPTFTSATNLHLVANANCGIDNKGSNAGISILTDIDNDVRSDTTTDIGADEFTSAPQTATVGSTQNICSSLVSTSLGGNTPSAGTGAWSIVSGGTGTFSDSSSGSATFTANAYGTYVLRWTITYGTCTSSADITVNYYLTPSNDPVLTADASPICYGQSTNINVPTANDGYSYQIKKQSDNSSLGTSFTGDGTTFSRTTGALSSGETYYVVISNGTCSHTGTNTVTVTVTTLDTPSVVIVSSDADNAICSGTSVTFTATPTNGGTPSYQWKLNGNDVGGNSDTYVTDTLRNNDQVKVVMTSSETCTASPTDTSDVIVTTINDIPLLNVVAFKDSTICDGAPVKLVAATGNGMSFTNSNSLSISSDSKFNFTNSMTFETWIKTTSTSSSYLASRESSFWVYLLEGAGNSGKVGFWLEGISNSWMISNKAVNDGKWHHVAATYDRQYMKIYIDGKLAAFEAQTKAMVSQNNAVYLGSRGGSFKFDGSMDEVRIWNSARSASEIAANMHAVVSSGSSGLVAYYRMDESSGTNMADSSGNGLNGTVGGTPSWLSPSKAPVSGNEFVSYNWSNGETTSSISFFTSYQSTYSVTATTSTGCTNTDEQTIYISGSTPVIPSVKITSSDADNIITSGTSVTFTATPTNGGSDPLFLWKKNDVHVGTNSATYSASDLADGDVVKVVMFGTAGCLVPTDTAVSNASTITIGTKVAASSNESNLAYPELGQYSATAMTMVNGFISFVSCNRFHTLAQTFTAQETAQLSRILFNVLVSNSSASSPIGSFDLKIYACSDDTTFTTLLGEVNDLTILSTGWKSVDVSSLHIPVTSGTKYGFLLSAKSGLNMLLYQDMTGSYTDGKIYIKRTTSCPAGSAYPNDSTWSGSSDLLFRITGTPLITPSVTITSSDSDNLICSGSSVTFTATPVNGGNSPSYQWKLNGSNVGTNSDTYTTSALSDGDSVKVVMTSNASDLTVDTAVSNTIKTTIIAVGSNDLWLGNTSTSWSEGSNWCSGSVPCSGASITIPAGLANYPVLGSNFSIADLELASGATLSLNGNELTITGNLSGTGRLIGSSTSSLVYSGSGSSDTVYFATTTPGTTDALANLTYDRSGQTLTVGNTLNVFGVITPTAGTLNANGNLVLKSNASGTARIAAGTGNYITGEVTVERYIPNRGRAYRLLTPMVNTYGSIKANWMENGMNTSVGTNDNPQPGYGTHITGIAGNVNGFDVTTYNSPSLYLTTNGVVPTYTAVNSTSGTLNAKTGYFLFIRGDRSMDLSLNNTNTPPNPIPLTGSSTTLRTKGTLVTGTVNSFTNALSSTTDALNLVTNPYASPISWTSVYGASTNITDYYTLWDPSIGYRGGFVTVSSSGVVSAGSATNVIQSGQAFFVQSTGTGSPSLVIEEAHKTSGNNNAVFAPATQPKASLQASIYYKEASGFRRLSDGVLSQMDAAYSNAVNSGDAVEITNWDENLAILQGGKRLAIEKRNIPTSTDTLNLYISNMKRMSYEMEVKAQSMADASLQPYLIDRFTGAQTLLKNNEATVAPFTVTSNAASSASNRFYIVFRNAGTLPVRIVQFKASAKDKAVQVNWQVEEDESVDHYEVERSKDQSAFNKIGVQMASGKNLASAQYSLLDNDPFTGNNFYRLKLVEKSGDIKFSKVERVTFSGRPWSVSVFPNPFSGTELQVRLEQWPAGNYRISITDVLGRVVYNRTIETLGGNLAIPIGLKGELASMKANAGVYWLKIEGEGIEEVRKVMRE